MSTVAWFWACGGLLSSARGHQLLGPSFLRDGSARPASQRQPGLPAASSFPFVGLHPATIPPSVGVPPASVTVAPVNAEAFQGAGASICLYTFRRVKHHYNNAVSLLFYNTVS